MEPEVFKYIGVGLMSFALFGAALGIGNIFSQYFNAVSRNPSCEPKIKTMLLIGAAFTEAMGLFGFLIALILIFA